MKARFVSIVIATYNSSGTLPSVLRSIRRQRYPRRLIETLVVDGGSTDETISIAKKSQCRIVTNPNIEPIRAKILGFQKASGEYLVYLDADEVLENVNSLTLKLSVFEKQKRVKAVIGSGYNNFPGASFITRYINDFGDPFSFFVYRMSKNTRHYYSKLKKFFPVLYENATHVIFDFSRRGKDLLLELGAAGTMIDLKYVRNEFPVFTPEEFSHLFQHLLSKAKYIAMVKDDPVIHVSTSDISGYLRKLNWRIKNNIHHVSSLGIYGYSGREKLQSVIVKIKKYLFIPYAYSLLFPLFDAVHLIYTRRNVAYILHLPLTILTASLIVYHMVLKLFGWNQPMRNYDESKVIPMPL